MKVLENRWPLVVIEWPDVTTRDDVERYLERSMVHLHKREPHLILHDASRGVNLAATERKRFADHLREQDAAIRAYTVAVAIATQSPLLRGLVIAVAWLTPTPCPQKAFPTMSESEVWLAEEFRKRTGTSPW